MNEAHIPSERIPGQMSDGDGLSPEINLEADKYSIASIVRQSNEISDVMGVIVDIANQTNMLSINAAIEAARSGEYGRGFNVIADEIRRLAVVSKESASRVEELIRGVRENTSLVLEMKHLNNTQNEMFRKIVDKVEEKIEVKDKEGRFVMINELASQEYGKPVAEIIGKSVFDFYDKATATAYYEHEKKLLKNRQPAYSLEKVILNDTKKYWFMERAPEYFEEREEWMMVIIQREVDEELVKNEDYISNLKKKYKDIKVEID